MGSSVDGVDVDASLVNADEAMKDKSSSENEKASSLPWRSKYLTSQLQRNTLLNYQLPTAEGLQRTLINVDKVLLIGCQKMNREIKRNWRKTIYITNMSVLFSPFSVYWMGLKVKSLHDRLKVKNRRQCCDI